eukprot:scaffold101_cov63-Phaeocystis_antarctica.AAC.1
MSPRDAHHRARWPRVGRAATEAVVAARAAESAALLAATEAAANTAAGMWTRRRSSCPRGGCILRGCMMCRVPIPFRGRRLGLGRSTNPR